MVARQRNNRATLFGKSWYLGLLAIFALLASSLHAKPLQRIYTSAYHLGRGDTGIASCDNEDAVFYNPAGLALGKGIFKKLVIASPSFEVSSATKDLLRETVYEKNADAGTFGKYVGKGHHVGVSNFTGLIMRRVAFGLFASASNDLLISKSEEYGALEQVDLSSRAHGGAIFSLAESFWNDTFALGATFKVLTKYQADLNVPLAEYETAADKDASEIVGSGMGNGADIGALYRIASKKSVFSLGLTIENVGDTKFESDQETTALEDLDQTVNAGIALETRAHLSYFKMLLDYRDILSEREENTLKKVFVGGEINFRNLFGFTGGIHHGYVSGGIYLNIRILRIDIGSYTYEMSDRVGARPDQRYFFKLTVGF